MSKIFLWLSIIAGFSLSTCAEAQGKAEKASIATTVRCRKATGPIREAIFSKSVIYGRPDEIAVLVTHADPSHTIYDGSTMVLTFSLSSSGVEGYSLPHFMLQPTVPFHVTVSYEAEQVNSITLRSLRESRDLTDTEVIFERQDCENLDALI